MKLVRFVRVITAYKAALRAHTQSIRSATENEKAEIRKTFERRVQATKLDLQILKQRRAETDRNQAQFYRLLLGSDTSKPTWPEVTSECHLSFVARQTFHEVKNSLILKAQKDVYKAEMDRLSEGSRVNSKSKLAKLKPLLNSDTGLLEIQGQFSSQEYDRFVTVLPKGHSITQLLVKDIHTNRLQHVGAVTHLMAEVKKHYFVPQLKSLVMNLLDSCYSCRRRFPRTFKQEMAPFHPGKLPGRLGESESPFAFSGSCNCDFLGPVYTSQGRGKAREKRWIFIFVCATTKAIYLQLVYSSATSDILTGILTFFMRKGVPKLIISDGQTGLSRCDKELKEIRSRIEGLKDRLDERIHGFASFAWEFTAPRTPTQNGAVERYMRTCKNAMAKMHEFNPKGHLQPSNKVVCLKDKEMEFLLVRMEFVLNSAPLVDSLNKDDDAEPLTRNHFIVGSNNPIQLSVPAELLDSPSVHQWKWFRIEEALLVFWKRWFSEHLASIKKLPKWTSGEVNLKEGDLVMVVDKDSPELKNRIKWPIARVLSVDRDQDGKIQTVNLRYKMHETRRGIRNLAPLAGVEV